MKKDPRAPYKVLVIEDQFLLAAATEQLVAELGYEVVGAAASRSHARDYLGEVDLALIDLHLLDGASGLDIARDFSGQGTLVIMVTANPALVPPDTDVAVGVLTKPVGDSTLAKALKYLSSRKEGREGRCPPELRLCLPATASAV